MDIIDNIINDWKSSIAPTDGAEFLSNKKNENIMEIFIAFEEKERKQKANLKAVTIGLSLVFSVTLLIYALLNFFNATSVKYNLEAIVIGSALMIIALTICYYLFKVNNYPSIIDASTLDYLKKLKSDLKKNRFRSFVSACILFVLYSFGAAFLLSGIFHNWFNYFLAGSIVYLLIIYVYAYYKQKKEYSVLHNEIDSLIDNLS